MKQYLTVSNFGLVLNLVGSILIAIAIDTPPVDGQPGWLDFASGRQYNFVTLNHPLFIKIGFVLLLFGFLLQLKRKSKGG